MNHMTPHILPTTNQPNSTQLNNPSPVTSIFTPSPQNFLRMGSVLQASPQVHHYPLPTPSTNKAPNPANLPKTMPKPFSNGTAYNLRHERHGTSSWMKPRPSSSVEVQIPWNSRIGLSVFFHPVSNGRLLGIYWDRALLSNQPFRIEHEHSGSYPTIATVCPDKSKMTLQVILAPVGVPGLYEIACVLKLPCAQTHWKVSR